MVVADVFVTDSHAATYPIQRLLKLRRSKEWKASVLRPLVADKRLWLERSRPLQHVSTVPGHQLESVNETDSEISTYVDCAATSPITPSDHSTVPA